jgi:hypothetical protein
MSAQNDRSEMNARFTEAKKKYFSERVAANDQCASERTIIPVFGSQADPDVPGGASCAMTCAMSCSQTGSMCSNVCNMCSNVCNMCANVCNMCSNACGNVCNMCGNVCNMCGNVCNMCGSGAGGCCQTCADNSASTTVGADSMMLASGPGFSVSSHGHGKIVISFGKDDDAAAKAPVYDADAE